jgi:hypothetical protein
VAKDFLPVLVLRLANNEELGVRKIFAGELPAL